MQPVVKPVATGCIVYTGFNSISCVYTVVQQVAPCIQSSTSTSAAASAASAVRDESGGGSQRDAW